MPATQTLTQTGQLDVTRRRLGRIGNIAIQNTETRSVSPLTLVPTAPVTSTPTFPLGAQTRRVDASGRFKPGFDSGSLSELLGWSAGGLDVTVVDGWLLLTQSNASRQSSVAFAATLGRSLSTRTVWNVSRYVLLIWNELNSELTETC